MANLIPLDEAARMLGLPTDELSEMIARGEIRGFKTGSTFKFKLEELQRVASDRGISISGGAEPADDLSSEFDLVDDSLDDELDLAAEGGSDVLADADAQPSEGASDTGKMVDGGDDLLLAEDDLFDDSELSLADGDDLVASDSDLEDSDLVLDEDSSSEIGISSEESGINLSPSDSGLSLEEEPAELADSDMDALALPEDDSLIVDDLSGDSQGDDDFMLTPVEESGDEDTSGSQVIALDDSEIYPDDSASGLLADSAGGDDSAPVLVAEDADVFGEGISGGDTMAQPVGQAMVAEPPEAGYTIPQVISLFGVLMLMLVASMLAFDNARNMWNQNESRPIVNPIADTFIQMVGLEKE